MILNMPLSYKHSIVHYNIDYSRGISSSENQPTIKLIEKVANNSFGA